MTFQQGPDHSGRSKPADRHFSRRVEDHYDMDAPRIKRVGVRDVLMPRVLDTDAPQVRSALAFRRRVMPLCIAATAVFVFLAWKTTPTQSVPASTVPVSSSK